LKRRKEPKIKFGRKEKLPSLALAGLLKGVELNFERDLRNSIFSKKAE
jgi:hypothetical protein